MGLGTPRLPAAAGGYGTGDTQAARCCWGLWDWGPPGCPLLLGAVRLGTPSCPLPLGVMGLGTPGLPAAAGGCGTGDPHPSVQR